MKTILVFSLSLLFFFSACNKNENPVEPSTYSDSELRSKIIGTWASNYVTVTFREDGTFFNTINYIIYSDSSTTLPGAIQGNYEIKDGILSYEITDWKRFSILPKSLNKSELINSVFFSREIKRINTTEDSENKIYPISFSSDHKIQFQDDLLYFYPVDILTSLGSNTEDIWGEWSTLHWGIGSRDGQDSTILDQLELRYKFDKNSMTVTYGYKFISDTLGSFDCQTDTVKYNPPDLTWYKNQYKKTIEFHNGKMYMFEKVTSPIPLTKVK